MTTLLPTLDDVALRANVSSATVSRCFNSPEQVNENTRIKVMEAIEELGYSPNFGAKALASKRTNTIGAVIPSLANTLFARGLEAFQEALRPAGATLLVASSYDDKDIEESQIRTMIARGADGLLLIGRDRSEKIYEFLESRKTPYVITWTYNENSKYSCVGFDNTAAAEELATSAIDMGHRHFAIVTSDQKNNDRLRDRVAGIRRAITNANLPASSLSVFESDLTLEAASIAFQDLIKAKPETTIVMCATDIQAVGIIKSALSMGIKVPADISVTGFGNVDISEVVQPAVTTVEIPHHAMGKKAADVLLQAMHPEYSIERIKLPTRIVERDSLGPPKSKS